jgi:hypothetical protein
MFQMRGETPESVLHWRCRSCDSSKLPSVAIPTLFLHWGLHPMALGAFDLLLFTTVVAIDIKESGLATVYTVDL